MAVEEYGNLVEKAFKIQNWNYSRDDREDKIIFTLDFERNGEYLTKCRALVYDSGICDMEACFPFRCPDDAETGIRLSYYIAMCNFSKRYATLRYDYEDGEIVNSYSFDMFLYMTPEFILSKFNQVNDIDEDDYKYIKDLCESKAEDEDSVVQTVDSDKKSKYKIDL